MDEEDMSKTFIDEVGQKSAVAGNTEVLGEEVVEKLNDSNTGNNNGDDNKYYYKEKKPKKSHGGLIGFIFLIIGLAIGAGGSYYYFEIFAKDTVKTEKKEEKVEKKEETISYEPDSIFIKDLIGRYDYYDMSDIQIYDFLYKEDKTNVKDMDEDYLKILAAKDANNSVMLGNFSLDEFQSSIKKLYGSKVTLENEKISGSKIGLCVEITYKNEMYSAMSPECGGTGVLGLERKIVKAEVKDDVLEVNVAVAVTDSGNKKVAKEYDSEKKELVDIVEDISYEDFDIDKDYSKFNQYKYTYKLDTKENNYYLESIELVK